MTEPDIFASSGGALNGLALVARHPEQVRTLVAHEPPAAQALPDREQALAAPARIVVGVGAESEGELAHRAGVAVAERLGTKVATATWLTGSAGRAGTRR
jgi:pimeloyl-ACP methyl ester carboxylesterase